MWGFDVSVICAWINGWVNNRKSGDLRRHRAHYHITVMHISGIARRKGVGAAIQMRLINDYIMGAMAFQITSLTIVYSTVYSGADQRKHQSSASLAFVTGEFPAQMAIDAENAFILRRLHDTIKFRGVSCRRAAEFCKIWPSIVNNAICHLVETYEYEIISCL